MINLNNLTISKRNYSTQDGWIPAPLKTGIMGYSPIFRLNTFEIDIPDSIRSLPRIAEYLSTYPSMNGSQFDISKYDIVEHYLACSFLTRTRAGYSFETHSGQTNEWVSDMFNAAKIKFSTKMDQYVSSPEIFNTTINPGNGLTNADLAAYFFNNLQYWITNNVNFKQFGNMIATKGLDSVDIMQAGKGYIGIRNINSGYTYPVILSVIKTEYIPYYRLANLVGMPIDPSMFEIWVNDQIEESTSSMSLIYDFVISNIFNKEKVPSPIEIKLKSGMSTYFQNYKVPQFKGISERAEWLTSLKNEFINNTYKPSVKLPIKEFEVQENTIVDSTKKLKSIRINKAINESKKWGLPEVVIPSNKVELIE